MSSGLKILMGGVGTVTPPQALQVPAEEAPSTEADPPQTPQTPQ